MATLSSIAPFYKLPDLRRRVFFTLGMLAVYRAGVFVSIPGVDRNAMNHYVAGQGGLLGLVNLFSGGALGQLSIFALGIMPYISASIVLQLAGMVYAPVSELRKDGEAGRRKIDQYTRYGTIGIALFQSFGIANWAESISTSDSGAAGIVGHPGYAFQAMTMITLTTGTAFLMWVGEQITERGVSNGTSLIIYAGIVTNIPQHVMQYAQQHSGDMQPLTIALFLAALVGLIATVVFFENGRRQIPIVYSRRQVGRRVYGANNSHLPLKVNISGTIPPIFASSLLMFPATIGSKFKIWGLDQFKDVVSRGGWVFNTGYALLIIFFTFFYTNITFQAVDVAENLKKQQANIPGIRPGKQTADYIYNVVQRITVGGATYCAAVCVLPAIIGDALGVNQMQYIGTSLMIVVGVALDTTNQIEAHLIQRNYEGLTGPGAGKIRGRRLPEGA